MENISDDNRLCVVCNKPLPKNVGANTSTHEGSCRKIHMKEMMRETNRRIKSQKVKEILVFLESKFCTGIDTDNVSEIISGINIHHISIEDFVMTSYYIFCKASGKYGITIDDIENVAGEWDRINGSSRMNDYLKRIKSRKKVIENAIENTKDNDQKKKMENKLKKYNRIYKNPKLGFNSNAYNLLQSKLSVAFANIHEETVSMIRRFIKNHGYESDLESLMIGVYESVKNAVLGKSPKVIVAGIFFASATMMDYSISIDDVVAMTGVSKPSIREVGEILDGMKVSVKGIALKMKKTKAARNDIEEEIDRESLDDETD